MLYRIISDRLKVIGLGAVALLLLLPILIPFQYALHVLIFSFIMMIFATSYDFLYGCAGQLTFGHAAPFGIGAYTTAFLVMLYHQTPWIALLVGALTGMAISSLIALPALRVRGAFLLIITLAFAEIMSLLVVTLWGEEGLSPVRLFLLWGITTSVEPLVKGLMANYYLALLLMLFSVGTLYTLSRSSIGIKMKAIRDDEDAAKAVGINVVKFKILAFIVSTFFAGLAGSFYMLYSQITDPWSFSVDLTARGLTMVIFGGVGTIIGPAAGAIILSFFFEYLRFLGPLRLIFYALIILLGTSFMPTGVIRKAIGYLSTSKTSSK